MVMKTCKKCHIPKELNCFYISKTSRDGRQRFCRKCCGAYKQTDTLHKRFNRWKATAKYREIPFEITEQDLEAMPMICHYTGIALTCDSKEINTISLDRLDSSKGYTTDNVVFCCESVNSMKQDYTVDQFILLCRWIVQHHDAGLFITRS
jgi:hypothetical protein